MKNILKTLIFAFLLIAVGSCATEEDNPVAIANGAAKLLTPATGTSFVLSRSNATNVVATLVWNHSESGLESPANYTVELAKTGTKFADPKPAGTTQGKFIAWTVEQLNFALDPAIFPAFFESSVDVRIKSSLGTGANAIVQYSNFITLKVTPYRVPAASSLWLVGAATPGGWTWDGDAETELPLISPGVYEVSVALSQNNAFRIFLGNNFTSNGNWDASKNYPSYIADEYTISAEFENANDGDSNFKYIGPTGVRILKIDTVLKKITLN